MALGHSPSIAMSGLVLCLDAANPNSYTVASPLAVEYLIVGGGGGGGGGSSTSGYTGGGGGGAGGFLTGTDLSLTPGTIYNVVVGTGGAGGAYNVTDNSGSSGTASSFAGISAAGGGGGGAGGNETNAARIGKSGGSGGGSGYRSTVGGAGNTPSTSPAQGNNGGNAGTGEQGSGGGGGAGQAGANGALAPGQYTGGVGGMGRSSSITGTTQFYAGGGGAGGLDLSIVPAGFGGRGGQGGGGSGGFLGTSPTVWNGLPGTPNTGGGGGGGSRHTVSNTGGAGGSGIVVIRYLGSQRATGGTITSVAGYTIHTFTSTGTFTVLDTSVWRDVSGQELVGTLIDNVAYNSSNGGSLTFNGTTQFVNCGASSVLNVGNTITVNAWFFVNSNASYQPIVAKNNIGGTLGWEMVNSSGTFRSTLRPTATQINVTAGALTVGQWYMGTMTFDGTTLRLYLNGVETGSGTGGPVTLNSPEPLLIANRGIDGGNFYNGRIAQVFIYNRALSAAEIQQNFNALRSRYGI